MNEWNLIAHVSRRRLFRALNIESNLATYGGIGLFVSLFWLTKNNWSQLIMQDWLLGRLSVGKLGTVNDEHNVSLNRWSPINQMKHVIY